MNKSNWIGLGVMALVVMVIGAGGVAAADLSSASARYPHTRQVINERVTLTTLQKGYASEDGAYVTDDDLMAVSAWYMGRYHIEPEPGMVAQGQCLRLGKVNGYYFFRQTVVVSLCPSGRGTQVSYNQTVYLGQ